MSNKISRRNANVKELTPVSEHGKDILIEHPVGEIEIKSKINIKNTYGCQVLSDIINKCTDKSKKVDAFNDCNRLIDMFLDRCLSK